MIRVSTANLYLSSNQSINLDQAAVMNTVSELSSGKQVNSPADNPVGAAQASMLQSNLTALGQFQSNQAQATQLLNNASSTVGEAVNVMQSVRTNLVQAGNSTLSSTDRAAIAAQLQQDLNQLVGIANTNDSQGGYLFGGSVNTTPPFVQNGNSVSYVGDNIVPGLQISQTRTEQVKYSGAAVFMQVPTGNGTFVTAAAGSNTGTGTIDAGTVTNPGALTGDSYKIKIGAGGSYTVVNTTTGSPVTTGTYANPTTLSFDGMQVQLGGAPASGDIFTIAPSGTQSIFGTIAGAISALQAPTGTAAQSAQATAAVSAALNNADQAITSLTTTQAAMGAQLGELNTYGTVNSNQTLQDQTQLSSIVDLNYANGVSQLTQQQTQMQAALQSYSAVSKLSLFNYM
jgi:flagellar hook-associated protein 3 FlgL